jgi:phosphatidylglycerophosphate synthase
MGYQATERRPLESRNLRIFQQASRWLAEHRVSPNTISILGMIAGCLSGLALAATARWPDEAMYYWLAGAVLIQLRLLANMLDGMVAIQSNRASAVGELYNEIPDRISDFATLVGLGYASGGMPMLGWLAAWLAALTAYIRAQGKAAGAAQYFQGPMAKPQRMALATATAVACAFLPMKWQVYQYDGHEISLPAIALAIICVGCVVTCVRRLQCIARDLRSKA